MSGFVTGGDHLCPYGRKLIGSLVPVHSRSVRSNTYAFLKLSSTIELRQLHKCNSTSLVLFYF